MRDFGRQLLQSVAYLHELTLIHTDLKPENILLQSGEYEKQVAPPGSRYVLLLSNPPENKSRYPRWKQAEEEHFASGDFDFHACSFGLAPLQMQIIPLVSQ